jgi:hypothetical protein
MLWMGMSVKCWQRMMVMKEGEISLGDTLIFSLKIIRVSLFSLTGFYDV